MYRIWMEDLAQSWFKDEFLKETQGMDPNMSKDRWDRLQFTIRIAYHEELKTIGR